MAAPLPINIHLNERQRLCLEKLVTQYDKDHKLHLRSRILLLADRGENNSEIAKALFLKRGTVAEWRKRWRSNQSRLERLNQLENPDKFRNDIIEILSDNPRSGAPLKFGEERVKKIRQIADELRKKYVESGRKLTYKAIAEAVEAKGIVQSISISSVRRILTQSDSTRHFFSPFATWMTLS